MTPLDPAVQRIAKRYDLDAAFLQAMVDATLARLQAAPELEGRPAEVATLIGLLREQGQRLEALIAQQQHLMDALKERI